MKDLCTPYPCGCRIVQEDTGGARVVWCEGHANAMIGPTDLCRSCKQRHAVSNLLTLAAFEGGRDEQWNRPVCRKCAEKIRRVLDGEELEGGGQ